MTNRHSEAAVPAGEEPALPQEDKTPPENAPDEKHTRRRRKGSWGNLEEEARPMCLRLRPYPSRKWKNP